MTQPVLTHKEIVCPTCYLATNLVLSTEPRFPSPGMLWYCRECHEIAAFDDNLDLRIATEEERKNARVNPENLPR
jgi:hypothetical protein